MLQGLVRRGPSKWGSSIFIPNSSYGGWGRDRNKNGMSPGIYTYMRNYCCRAPYIKELCHDLRMCEIYAVQAEAMSACFNISNRPLPFHLHLHEIYKFLDSECSTNVVKVQVSSILKEKKLQVTSKNRSRSARPAISCPNH